MAIFFQKWLTTSRSWLILLRPIFRDDFFFLFRINFKGIFVHYSKNRLLEGDFATCPHPSRSGCLQGLPPVGAVPSPQGLPPAPGAAPNPGGCPQPPGAAPSPRFFGGWGWGLPQPPSPRGLGAAPGGWGLPQPPGAETVPIFWGQPPKISAPTKNSLCVGGVFRNPGSATSLPTE